MKDIIATRNTGAGMIYVSITVIGLIITVTGIFAGPEAFAVPLFGIIISAACGYFAVKFLMTPSLVMWLDDDGRLCLPKDVVLEFSDIVDVSYERASARGIQYKWGEVTVKTHLGSYRYGFISECESVAKRLTELMHKAKYSGENNK